MYFLMKNLQGFHQPGLWTFSIIHVDGIAIKEDATKILEIKG